MTKTVLTLGHFISVAILWIFGGYLNPIISQLLGLQNQLVVLTVRVALSAAIVILCNFRITGFDSTKKIQNGACCSSSVAVLTLSSVLTQSGASTVAGRCCLHLLKYGHYYVMAWAFAAFIVCLARSLRSNTASAACPLSFVSYFRL